MRAQLTTLWDDLRASYWFVPSLMCTAAAVVAIVAVELESALGPRPTARFPWIYAGGAEGARAVLSTIAGSLITLTSLVFSITIVALTLAAQQFGPRLLRNFLRDRSTQISLGTFTATFIYCLLVLRTITGSGEDAPVPHLSVTIGVLLAVCSVALLIYFIHHLATSLHVDAVIEAVQQELMDAIAHLYPGEAQAAGTPRQTASAPDFEDGAPLKSPTTGYLQVIDLERLIEAAATHDVVVGLNYRPGHFVVRGATLADVVPATRVSDAVRDELTAHLVIGDQRTMLQDVEFGIERLVEIGLRALSPGTNDPFTAMRCIDRLAAALCRAATAEWPPAEGFDGHGNLRLVARARPTFGRMIAAAFDQLRQAARPHAAVSIRLLEAMAIVAACCPTEASREVVLQQARMVRRGAMEELPERYDRDAVDGRFRRVLSAAGRTGEEEEP